MSDHKERFEELQKRTSGPEGATPLEWCIVEMHKSYNPVRAELAAQEYSDMVLRMSMLSNSAILNYEQRVRLEAQLLSLQEQIGILERKLKTTGE